MVALIQQTLSMYRAVKMKHSTCVEITAIYCVIYNLCECVWLILIYVRMLITEQILFSG